MVSVTGNQQQTQGAEAKTFLDSFRLPDPSELASKGQDPASPGAKAPPAIDKNTPQQLRAILLALQSNNNAQVGRALDLLIATKPIPAQKDLVVAVLQQVVLGNVFQRGKAVQALVAWGGDDANPTLVQVLRGQDFAARWAILDAIRDLKLSKLAPEVVERMLVPQDRHQAVQALKAMGPDAEPEVLKLLTNGEWQARNEACRLLQVIGTQKSLAELQKALDDENAIVKRSAQEAIKAIERRKG